MPDKQTDDTQVMAEGAQQERTYYEFLEGCLRHRSEMVCSRMLTYAHVCSRMHTYAHVCSRMQVIFEAARAICQLPNVSQRELTPAVTVLQVG